MAEARPTTTDDITGLFEERFNSTLSIADLQSTADTQRPSTDWSNLTVCEPSKVEREFLSLPATARTNPSVLVVIGRWIVAIFIALLFLGCLIASKLSALSIGAHIFHISNATANAKIDGIRLTENTSLKLTSSFLWLLLAIVIPYFFSLVQCLVQGACRSDKLWPCWSAVLWSLLASVLESTGLTLFVMGVLCTNQADVTVWVMSGVFAVPIFWHIVDEVRSARQAGELARKWIVFTLVFALIVELVGIVITCVLEVKKYPLLDVIKEVWEVPVSLLLLSIAWSPQIQKRQLFPRTADFRELLRRTPAVLADHAAADDGDDHHQPIDEVDPADVIFVHPEFSCRWKISALNSFLRAVFVVIGCCVYAHLKFLVDFSQLDAAFRELTPGHELFPAFMVSLFCSVAGNVLAFVGCTMCMQKLAFAVPLVLATPISCLAVVLYDLCVWPFNELTDCNMSNNKGAYWWMVLLAALCLVVAQIASTVVFIFKTNTLIMQKASQLFWMPGYNSIFLEQILLLNRKNFQTNRQLIRVLERARETHVIICTTMYREAAHEMEQLLMSIRSINEAKQASGRNFESHIFFDNGVRGTKLTEFALQLACIVKSTLEVQSSNCTRMETPYGMRLTWVLPSVISGERGMPFTIHLKDNQKVKSKKRWSQVMYMSYVVDFFLKENEKAKVDNTFILTTDADVKFTPDSVEALLDLMVRDHKVGAVCSRTFPLGSGPVYWYQIFDYAIGHWLQKASNHVLGSVLCSPGCFSVYRVEAVRDILSTYGSQVEKASEFLTKDMGEDRWLCTLMVQSGWRLEYCAVASNSTYCPEDFDEFFKQRRRWIPSTLANQFLLLQEWNIVAHFNKGISVLFLLYQALLLFSTLINPSVSMQIIVGGLYYAWNIDQIVSTIVLILITLMYAAVCLYCSQEKQLMIAKILTCLSAIVMAVVTIGTILQIVDENTPKPPPDVTTVSPSPQPHPPPKNVTSILDFYRDPLALIDVTHSASTTLSPVGPVQLPVSVTALYLAVIIGIFLVTALMHLSEMYCLLHGIWYLLCLPASNLVLLIYSICNLTDRSWGTREEKKLGDFAESHSWQDTVTKIFKKIFFCCFKDNETGSSRSEVNQPVPTDDGSLYDDVDGGTDSEVEGQPIASSVASVRRGLSRKYSRGRADDIEKFQFAAVTTRHLKIREWLPQNLQSLYASSFEMNGYDDTSFLYGLGDSDLKELGIKMRGHRYAIRDAIKLLPEPEIEPCVPDRVREWLANIGLSMYFTNFQNAHIVSGTNMEILKTISREEVVKELNITKIGHQKRLLLAISKLRYPTQTEKAALQVKYELAALPLFKMEQVSPVEYDFWEQLRIQRLLPDSVVFANDLDLKEKLEELRNSSLLALALINVIWLIVISTLVTKSQLNVLGTNPLGLSFLVIFGVILIVQFFCMIVHRFSTWMHMIARAPMKCGDPYNASWAFSDDHIRRNSRDRDGTDDIDNDDRLAQRERDRINRRMLRRYQRDVDAMHSRPDAVDHVTNEHVGSERAPLLGGTSGQAANRRGYQSAAGSTAQCV